MMKRQADLTNILMNKKGPLQIDEDAIYHGELGLTEQGVFRRCGCGGAKKCTADFVGYEGAIPRFKRADYCDKCGYAIQWTTRYISTREVEQEQ